MKHLSLILTATAFLFVGACERHTWEDNDANGDGKIDQNEKGTSRLYKDDHGSGHAEGDEKAHKEGEDKDAKEHGKETEKHD